MFKLQAMKIGKRDPTPYCNAMTPKWEVTFVIKRRDYSMKTGT